MVALNQYTLWCFTVPAVFNIIFNQTSYSVALNESSAIAGNPLIHFTIFARGSLISESVTKSLEPSISSNTGFKYFSLDPNTHELGMTSISSQPVPSVFVVSGTIWVSPKKLPPPDVYIMTLRATVLARSGPYTDFHPQKMKKFQSILLYLTLVGFSLNSVLEMISFSLLSRSM